MRPKSALGSSFHLQPVTLSREALTHQSNVQDIRAELQSTASPQGILKLPVAGVSLREKPQFPREEAGLEPWSLLPLDNRIRAHPPAFGFAQRFYGTDLPFASLLAPRHGLLSCFAAFGALFFGIRVWGLLLAVPFLRML